MARVFLNFDLTSPEWGITRISRIIPQKDNPWGQVAPLRDTPWGKGIVIVTGEAFSHALHGNIMPLIRSLGSPPELKLKRIPEGWRTCLIAKTCLSHNAKHCHPGPKLPDCYIPPQIPLELQELTTQIAIAWRDNFYVLVVEGPEFTL